MEKNNENDIYEILIPKEPYKVCDNRTLDQEVKEELSDKEKEIIKSISQYLEEKNFQWRDVEIKDYKFRLPSTAFNEARQIELFDFEDAEVEYEDENEVLSPENMNDISKKGEFSIKSKSGKTYIWKVTTWLIQGTENRVKNYESDISIVFEMLYYFKYRFNTKFKYANIYRVFKNFYYFFRDLLRLLIGTPYYGRGYDSKYPEKIFTEYNKDLLELYDINTVLYHPKVASILKTLDHTFNKEWNEERYIIENEVRKLEGKTEEEIQIIMLEKRIDKMIDYFSNSKNFKQYNYTKEMQESLIQLIKSKHIVINIEADHLNKVDLMKKTLMESILKDHPIKSKIKPWLNKHYFTEEKIRILDLEKERNREREDKLKEFPFAIYIMEKYEEQKRQESAIKKELIESDRKIYNFGPFSISRCTPVVKSYETEKNNLKTISYYLSNSYEMGCDAGYYFWRWIYILKLFIFLICNWTILFKKWLFNNSFGIMALFCYDLESDRYMKNSDTGEIGINYCSYTYPSSFSKIAKWITESRENFLRNRFTNFFGSKFGNFINIIENYFLKFFILGILNTIFYPVGILIFTMLCILLYLVGLVCIFAFIIISIFFILFIYDSLRPGLGCYIFPLPILIIWRIFICIGFSFLFWAFLCIIQVFWAIFMLIFAHLRYVMRTIYDAFTMCLIGCFAKVPKTDSSVAWKVSGPGINRAAFKKISIDDALMLLRSELEKIELDEFKNVMIKKIKEPETFLTNFSNNVLKRVNAIINVNNNVIESNNRLENVLISQYNSRYNIYPFKYMNFRFTQEDLEVFLIASQDLIKDYVESHEMNYIWKKYSLVEGNWNLLTEKILKLFGDEVLENVDDCAEMIESKKKDNQIKQEILNIQREANILDFHSKALSKRKKFARKIDLDEEDLNITGKYLTPRKFTSTSKYDDSYIRTANLDFLCFAEDAFNIKVLYLEKSRREKEEKLANKFVINNDDNDDSRNDEVDEE